MPVVLFLRAGGAQEAEFTGEPSKDNKLVYGFKDANLYLKETLLPVDGIEFTYDTHESIEHITIYGEDSIMAIVKNIIDGSEARIDRLGRVSLREAFDPQNATALF